MKKTPETSIKAIILSAGQGRRLLPLTENSPKCLLPISGKTIIEWQIDALLAAGIEEIIVQFRGSRIYAGLEKILEAHINVYLQNLIDRQIIFSIGYNGKWQVKKLLEIGNLIQRINFRIKNYDIGMCVSAENNLYSINWAGNIETYNLKSLLELNFNRVV